MLRLSTYQLRKEANDRGKGTQALQRTQSLVLAPRSKERARLPLGAAELCSACLGPSLARTSSATELLVLGPRGALQCR